MECVTLVFDVEIQKEDLALYEGCEGVAGVSGYGNVVNVYYKSGMSKQETDSLLQAVFEHKMLGANLLSSDLDEEVIFTQTIY